MSWAQSCFFMPGKCWLWDSWKQEGLQKRAKITEWSLTLSRSEKENYSEWLKAYLKQPCCYHRDVTCLHAAPSKAFSPNADTHMTRASWCDLGKQSFPLSVSALVEKSYKWIPGVMILTLMFWEWPYTGSFCFQKKHQFNSTWVWLGMDSDVLLLIQWSWKELRQILKTQLDFYKSIRLL